MPSQASEGERLQFLSAVPCLAGIPHTDPSLLGNLSRPVTEFVRSADAACLGKV